MATMGKVACTNQLRFGIDHSWKVFHQTQPWKEILALSAVLSTYWTVRHRAAQLIIEATRKTCLALNLLLSLWGSRWGEWRLGQGAKRSEYYTELWREDKGPPWPHPCSQEWPVSWILVDNVTWHRMLCCFSSILLTHGKPESGQGEVGDTGQLKNANLMGQTNKTCHHQLGIHKTRSALTEVQSWLVYCWCVAPLACTVLIRRYYCWDSELPSHLLRNTDTVFQQLELSSWEYMW